MVPKGRIERPYPAYKAGPLPLRLYGHWYLWSDSNRHAEASDLKSDGYTSFPTKAFGTSSETRTLKKQGLSLSRLPIAPTKHLVLRVRFELTTLRHYVLSVASVPFEYRSIFGTLDRTCTCTHFCIATSKLRVY